MLLSTLATTVLLGSSLAYADRRDASWSDVVESVRSMPQTWTNVSSRIAGRSSFQFDVGCTGTGVIQSPQYTDLYDAVHTWFSSSDTGPKCRADLDQTTLCAAAANPSQDGCGLAGSYAVWNDGVMDCYAYVLLEKAVIESCADGGWGDCGCGVYYDYGAGKCLVATFTYHASGPSVFGAEGGPAVPGAVGVDVIHKRDSTGPSYTDISVCKHYSYGDVETWCEGAATHVC